MFWDKIAGLYDLFENIYNKSVFQETEKSLQNMLEVRMKFWNVPVELEP